MTKNIEDCSTFRTRLRGLLPWEGVHVRAEYCCTLVAIPRSSNSSNQINPRGCTTQIQGVVRHNRPKVLYDTINPRSGTTHLSNGVVAWRMMPLIMLRSDTKITGKAARLDCFDRLFGGLQVLPPRIGSTGSTGPTGPTASASSGASTGPSPTMAGPVAGPAIQSPSFSCQEEQKRHCGHTVLYKGNLTKNRNISTQAGFLIWESTRSTLTSL